MGVVLAYSGAVQGMLTGPTKSTDHPSVNSKYYLQLPELLPSTT